MNGSNSAVDDYFRQAKTWRQELSALRTIILDAGLTEQWKWSAPCYSFAGHNIVIVGAFKESCALTFFKGALLRDPHNILVKPGANTQAARVIRFTDLGEIIPLTSTLKSYLQQAMELEQSGSKVDVPRRAELVLPAELQSKFADLPALETAFMALTPGRQRAYILHFSAAKQTKTRSARIENSVQRILNRQGINDCVCGLSRKMPVCDGSHKSLR